MIINNHKTNQEVVTVSHEELESNLDVIITRREHNNKNLNEETTQMVSEELILSEENDLDSIVKYNAYTSDMNSINSIQPVERKPQVSQFGSTSEMDTNKNGSPDIDIVHSESSTYSCSNKLHTGAVLVVTAFILVHF